VNQNHTKKIAFKTLGCRLNQYETDALVTDFDKAGYQLVGVDESPDVVVINTCTVTNQSDQKSRTTISQAARANSNAVVVVTGCMANNFKEKLESQDNITFVVENNRKSSILSLVDAHFSGEILHPNQLPQDVFRYEPVQKSLHTRSAVRFASFQWCVVVLFRGLLPKFWKVCAKQSKTDLRKL
jgi:threonylcarbamoyladenosine tRNA methylthiotransferase MtaB